MVSPFDQQKAALRDLLVNELKGEAEKFSDAHLENLVAKGYMDIRDLQDATRQGLESPPPLPPALIDKLLRAFQAQGQPSQPSIVLNITREAAQHFFNSADIDEKSYAPSSANITKAEEAAARLGWKLQMRKVFKAAPSERQVNEFLWPEREDDSTSKLRVKHELLQQLQLSEGLRLIEIERKVLVTTEAEVSNKRTKITAKTDFVIVLAEAERAAKKNPGSMVHYIAMLFETKTSQKLAKEEDLCRGGAALESLAVNMKLLEREQIGAEDYGVPVFLTDMNEYTSFIVERIGDEVIQEYTYRSPAEALDHMSAALDKSVERLAALHGENVPSANQGAGGGPPGAAAGGSDNPQARALCPPPSSHPTTSAPAGAAHTPSASEPAKDPPSSWKRPSSSAAFSCQPDESESEGDDVEMHLGTKNILSAIYDSAPSDARPSMRVFVEDLSMAVAKALVPSASPQDGAAVMHEVPQYAAHLYV